MHFLEIIKRIKSTNSRLDKEAIVREAAKSGYDDFFTGVNWAYAQGISFGVKQVPIATHQITNIWLFNNSLATFSDFSDLAVKLINRDLTGHAARDAIQELCNKCDPEHWNLFYRPILLKDLDAGFGESTINRVMDDLGEPYFKYKIEVYPVALAKPVKDHPKKLKGKMFLDEKHDGTRLIATLQAGGTVTLRTREGAINTNFNFIHDELSVIAVNLTEDIILDGEVISENFQELMTQVNRKSNVDTSDARFMVFDILPLVEFRTGKGTKTQAQRHSDLQEFMNKWFPDSTRIKLLEKTLVDFDTQTGRDTYESFKRDCIIKGLEGVMIKSSEAVYEEGRHFHWLKYKPSITVDLTIVGSYEGTKKNVGRLGGFSCRGSYEGMDIEVDVGGGYKEQQRIDFWNNRDQMVGQIIEVQTDKLTENKSKPGVWSLRFPQFVRFRSIDPGQKI